MTRMKILAISSSRVGKSEYLEMALPEIKKFLGDRSLKVAFLPFAFVGEDVTRLADLVAAAFTNLPYSIEIVTKQNGTRLIENADVIMVSGGNTFKLLHDLYDADLLNLVKGKVKMGTPYIGWSAGANITGATICTTNDMPIVEPESFRALNFFPFQINPHYYNVVIEGHNGETRDDRLREFVKLNPGVNVVCLPEGTALLMNNGKLQLIGDRPGILMSNNNGKLQKDDIQASEDISHLLAL
jgi:dipeptidase E